MFRNMLSDCNEAMEETGAKRKSSQSNSAMTSTEHIMVSMSEYYNNPEMSDVIVKLGNTSYYAHKFVLGLMSDVFRIMCSDRWDGDNKVLKVQECEECIPVFGNFMKFLYCGDIDVDINSALPLLMLADKYNIQPLKQKFEQYMKKTVQDGSVTGALRWLSYAQVSNHNLLESACIDVVVTRMDEVVASEDFLRLEYDFLLILLTRDDLVVLWEKTLFDALIRWIDHHQNIELGQIKWLLSLIRLPMMLPDQLYEVEVSAFCQTHKDILLPLLAAAHRFRSIAVDVHSNEFCGPYFTPRNYTHRLWCHFLTVEMNGETFYQNSVGARCVNHPVLSEPEQYWQIRVLGEKRGSRNPSGHKPSVLPNLGYVFTPTTAFSEKCVPLRMTVTPLRPVQRDVVVDISLFQVKKDKVVKPLCHSYIKFAAEEYFMRLENGEHLNKYISRAAMSPQQSSPKFNPTPMNFALMFQQSHPTERHEVTLQCNFNSQNLDHPPEVPCFKFNGPLRMTNSVRVAIVFKPRFVKSEIPNTAECSVPLPRMIPEKTEEASTSGGSTSESL